MMDLVPSASDTAMETALQDPPEPQGRAHNSHRDGRKREKKVPRVTSGSGEIKLKFLKKLLRKWKQMRGIILAE